MLLSSHFLKESLLLRSSVAMANKGIKRKRESSQAGLKRSNDTSSCKTSPSLSSSAASSHAPPITSQPRDVTRRADDTLVFDGFDDFRPNLSPKQVLQMGSFGGTYFRPIKSSVTGESYKDVWKELPVDWLSGLKVGRQVASNIYDESVNKFDCKCGGSLQMWEQSGWIVTQDPYGWFQWYCRFYQGRRSNDDTRQVSRWLKCAGIKGRWRNNLITKVVKSGYKFDDRRVSPVVRQTLQHWGYQLTESDFKLGEKRAKKD